jgi:hydrogenase small subunit
MANEAGAAPYGRKTQHTPAIDEFHILWITAGLGCDGDTVSITAASEPSIEDVLLGAIPGLPKVHLHNPVLAVEVGDDFMKFFHQADRGEIDNFVLVLEGSIPNEKISGDGYWAAYGNDPKTGQPIRTTEWIDRLAPKALAVVGAGTCATYGGIHAMQGNPTGCMGLQDYLGHDWRSKAGLPIVNVPGCPVQPDNFMETLLYLLRQLAGLAPMIPVDDLGRPRWLFGNTVHNGCDRAAYYERADFTKEYGSPQMPGKDRLPGSGGAMQCAETRLDLRDGRLPQCWRHLHWLHDAGFSGQVHAVHGRASRCRLFLGHDQTLWHAYPSIASNYQQHPQR